MSSELYRDRDPEPDRARTLCLSFVTCQPGISGRTLQRVSFITCWNKNPFGGPGQFPFQLWANFPRRVVLKLMLPHPTLSAVSTVSSCLKVWTYSLVKSSGLRHYMFSLKCKFILHTAVPVVFLLLSFISFLSSECLTIMKPGLLRDASLALW